MENNYTDNQYYDLMRRAASNGMSVDQYTAYQQQQSAAQQAQTQAAIDAAVKRALEEQEQARKDREEYNAFLAWKKAQHL